MRGWVLGGLAWLGCAPATRYHRPETARGYAVLVSGKDSLSVQLAQALRHRGITVFERVRGGARPTAALLHFTFRDVTGVGSTSLHVQLADTRTGAVVAAAVIVIDSVPATGISVEAILDSLGV